MATGGVSFEEHSLNIAKDFLHTVVVVDDEAEYGPAKADPTSTLKTPGKSDTTSNDSEVPPVHMHPLNAKQLIDTFAELGMVCAILKPGKDEDFMEKTDHASKRADIVVLDWRICGDYGNNTTQTIKKIIQTDNGRLRLIVVYSGQNLDEIFDKLEEIESSAIIDRDRKKITFGNVRLILLAKEQTEQNNFPDQTCNEQELPSRIIKEFRDFTMGLLSNAALKSISLIRANAHMLLTHFRHELDAAFLTHRALTTPPDESENHIGPLLLDEMRSILDNKRIGEQVNIETIRSWMEYQSNNSTKYRNRLGIRDNENFAKNKLLELLEKGHERLVRELRLHKEKARGKWQKLLKKILDPNNIHKLTAIWANQTNAKTIDKQLAYQMISNRIYKESLPMLRLGTIIQRIEDQKLFLCVQPLCDCVRIDGRREFTFLRLRKPIGHFLPELLIQTGADFQLLYVNYKPFESYKIRFQADAGKQFIISKKSQDDDYIFKSVEAQQKQYKFITELKSQIAHRILTKYGNEVSRLGLTEPEWLRRSGRG